MLMTKAICKVYMQCTILRNVKNLQKYTIYCLNIFFTYVYIRKHMWGDDK